MLDTLRDKLNPRGAGLWVLLGVILLAGVAIAGTSGSSSPTDSTTTTTLVVESTTTLPIVTTTTTRPTITTQPGPRGFTIAFSGDVLLHPNIRDAAETAAEGTDRAYDFRPMFQYIESFIKDADWAVCHLLGVVSPDGTGLSDYGKIRVPGEIVSDLAEVGFDACTTASHHSLDYGFDGVTETLGVFDEAGLRFTGTARSEREEILSRRYGIEGVQVTILSYTFSTNGIPTPEDAPWATRLIEEKRILEDAALAREEGAEFVILSLHWGDPGRHGLNYMQSHLGPRLIASPDIDLIVGHHSQVIQPIDKIGSEWIVYGMGNLVAASAEEDERDEIWVVVEVGEQPDGTFQTTKLSVMPMHMLSNRRAPVPTGIDLRFEDLEPWEHTLLSASWKRAMWQLRKGSGWGEFELIGESPY